MHPIYPPPTSFHSLPEAELLRTNGVELVGELPDPRLQAFLAPLLASGGIPLYLGLKMDALAGGYRLQWNTHSIQIEAATLEGLRNGLLTLSQVLAGSDPVAAGEVVDHPAFAERGFMLDVSRCRVPRMETLAQLISQLARLKYNQLQLYTEHTFAYEGHEAVWAGASPYTAEEIRQIDDACHAHFIELVPNQNSFGHMERWLKHPAYRHLAEQPAGYASPWGGEHREASTLRPEPDSLALLDDLYTQLLPNFRSRRINVGCDETFELGQGASRERCEASGKGRVYLDFLHQVHELVSRHGAGMMFWGDIIHEHPELIPELPSGLTALEWGYEAGHPFTAHAAAFSESNIPFYICPGTSSWRSIVGRTTNMRANLKEAAAAGRTFGASGFLLTDWGDVGHLQPWAVSFPGIVDGACRAWNPEAEVDLGPTVDEAFELPSGLGQLLLEAGEVQDLIHSKTLANASPLFHLLLRKPHPDWDPTDEERDRCLAAFDQLASQLVRFSDHPSGREAALAVDILRFALHRDDRLLELIERHRALWLARHRPGGLDESCGWLQAEL